jgi:DNA-binding transcriptional LysR family regulator
VSAVSPACLERHGTPRDRHIFETAPYLVLVEQADAGRWVFVKKGETVALQVKAAVVANDMDRLRHAALSGLGFVMLSSFLIAAELESGTLRVIEGDWQLIRSEVHAVYPRHRVASLRVRALIDYLREQLAEVPRWMPPAPR